MLAPFGIKGVKSFLGGAGAILKLPNLSARFWVTSWLGGAGVILKQPNLSPPNGVKSLLLRGAGAIWKQPGKVGQSRCWEVKQLNLSARIGQALLGGAGAILKQPSLSARIEIKSLLGGVLAPFCSNPGWGAVVVVGRCWHRFEASKPVTPHWGNVVVVERWWCHVEAPAFEHDYTIGKFVNHGSTYCLQS